MQESEIKIIDNYIPKEQADQIADNMIGSAHTFPWFYHESVDFSYDRMGELNVDDFLDNYQFIHMFYSNWMIQSVWFDMLQPITSKLNPIGWQRIKANLNPRTEKPVQYNYHTDYQSKNPYTKTAIWYVNSNNGVTFFKDGTVVESVANRIVIFPQLLYHTGTTCTDQKVRSVINFNYIDRDE